MTTNHVQIENVGSDKMLSVQICSHNRKNLLREVIYSLSDQTYPKDKFEIIIVDDGSTDGTDAMVEEVRSPVDLVFIKQAKEGLAAGRNKGILKARGAIILFIDDDVLADPRLVEEHVRFHETHSGCVVKGWVNHVPIMKRPSKPRWTIRDYSKAFFWTSNVSVEKKYLEQVGLFDEDFKEYGWEDLELGLRLKALGLKSVVHPTAIGFHYKKAATGADLSSMLVQAEAKGRTAVVFIQKNRGWRARLSTGIYPLRMFLDKALSNRFFMRLCKQFIPQNGKPLSAWSQFCAKSLTTARYFDAIRKALRTST